MPPLARRRAIGGHLCPALHGAACACVYTADLAAVLRPPADRRGVRTDAAPASEGIEGLADLAGDGGFIGGGAEDGGFGGDGNFDMAKLQEMMAQMGGGAGGAGGMPGMMGGGGGMPDLNAGVEKDGGDGKTSWKWEQSDDEITVRIELSKPAKKADLKVSFAPGSISVTVFGDTVFDKAALAGRVYSDECSWCIAEKGTELQLLLAPVGDAKWSSLLKED